MAILRCVNYHQTGSCRAAPTVYTTGSSILGSEFPQRNQIQASTNFNFNLGGNLSRSYHPIPFRNAAVHYSSPEYFLTQQQLRKFEIVLHRLYPPMLQSSPEFYSGICFSSRECSSSRCRATQTRSRTNSRSQISQLSLGRCILLSSSRTFSARGAERGMSYSSGNQGTRSRGVVWSTSGGSSAGSLDWMSKASPYEVLGVSEEASEEEVKAAFRARIKEYHPDVYQGMGDADAITQRLLRAYELLTNDGERAAVKRKSFDPFKEPECVAGDVFVNELACIGQGCPYSCVERAPDVFQFASDTGCARAMKQGRGGEYHVQLAVGQCPNNCIHYMTPAQRFQLEDIMKRVLEGTIYSSEVVIMDGLIARANFENGRYQTPKRKVKKSEKWVDWY